MKSKHKALIYIFLVVGFSLFLVGCNHTRPVIIDGIKAKEIENRINVMALDQSLESRGNSVSNIRNGGSVFMTDSSLFIIQDMEFDEDVSYYLQRLPISSIGSLSQHPEILKDLHAIIVAQLDDYLYYINEDDSKVYRIDLGSLETTQLFSEEVSAFRVFDGVGYVSSLSSGSIYSITFDERMSSVLLIEGGGKLLGMNEETLFTLAKGKEDRVINAYDKRNGELVFSLVDGPFIDAEIAGSFVYFKDGDTIKRKILDDSCECVDASVIPGREYAIYGNNLIISGVDKGIFLSYLDGSHIILISEDKANNLQLFDDYLLYKNENDYNSWYVIQFSTESRSALLGETMSDGGIKFSEVNSRLADSFHQYFGNFIDSVKDLKSSNNTTQSKLGSRLLFVDTRDELYRYYTLTEEPFTPDECDGIVLISNNDVLLGQYTDGDLAYRKDTILTLFALGDSKPLMSLTSEGYPPIDVKHGKGDRYGLWTSWHPNALLLLQKMR